MPNFNFLCKKIPRIKSVAISYLFAMSFIAILIKRETANTTHKKLKLTIDVQDSIKN